MVTPWFRTLNEGLHPHSSTTHGHTGIDGSGGELIALKQIRLADEDEGACVIFGGGAHIVCVAMDP